MNEQAVVDVRTSSCQGPGHQTALHQAAMVGNSYAMAALIQGGCAVDLQTRDGNTALHEVSWHGFSQCVKLLVKAGADVHIRNKAGNTALHLACQNAHAEAARLLLLGRSSPDTKNKVGDTCLHVAARYNNLTLVKILLGSICSVPMQNKEGNTALHVAAALNHKKTAQLLLEAGTDGRIRNNAGKTALDKARDNNHKDMAILLARAPEVHRFMRGRTLRKQRERLIAEHRTQSVTRVEIQPNKAGKTPLDKARDNNHKDMAILLARSLQEDSVSVVEGSPNSEQTGSRIAVKVDPQRRQQQFYNQTPVTIGSPYSHHKRRDRKQILDEVDARKGKTNFHIKRDRHCDDGFTHVYTLYRDVDGNNRQAPANGCHCKPLMKKLEGQMKATQKELRLHIPTVQERVNSRMGKMDERNRHQQAAVNHELKTKRWWMSHMQDGGQYCKLLPSPSVEQSEEGAGLESLPLLSVVSGDSSTSLANYVNILPSKSAYSLGSPAQGQMGVGSYFEMKAKRSSDDYVNTAPFPLPTDRISVVALGSADPLWQCPVVQDSPVAAVVPLYGEGISSSSSQSTNSELGPGPIPHQENRHDRKHFGELTSPCRYEGIHTDSTRTLQCLIEPSEPSSKQERNYLHAMEVTQRFFDTVSTQLELWYERKLVAVKQQMELNAQQDRKELLQRISLLEEELERLKVNERAES